MAYGKDNKHYPPETVAEARRRYAMGEKVKEIAEDMGLTVNCVYQWVGKKRKTEPVSNAVKGLDEACGLLATQCCPYIWFNRDPIKCDEIKEKVCPNCECAVERKVYKACWLKYFESGL